MLEVQKFLRESGTIEQLSNDLGIKSTYHSESPLVIVNYDQLNSPKNNDIARECRGLTLELNTWNVIGRSFKRFFNLGEMVEEQNLFNFSNCSASNKEDGSLVTLYHYDNNWRLNTRGSFAEGFVSDSGKTWNELIWATLDRELVNRYCVPGHSYVFEYCDVWNQQVTIYPQPTSFLLTVVDNDNGELSIEEVDLISEKLQVPRPKRYTFHSFEEVRQYVDSQGRVDVTWEGVVLFDGKHRWKVKSEDYLIRHRMLNNGNGITYKNLVPWVLRGEGDEIAATLPQCKDRIEEIKIVLDNAYSNLIDLWENTKGITSQKEFAQAIIPRTKFSNLLFKARKQESNIREIWNDSEDLILKVLFDK